MEVYVWNFEDNFDPTLYFESMMYLENYCR